MFLMTAIQELKSFYSFGVKIDVYISEECMRC